MADDLEAWIGGATPSALDADAKVVTLDTLDRVHPAHPHLSRRCPVLGGLEPIA